MRIAVVTNSFNYSRFSLFEKMAKNKNHKITIFKYADWWGWEAKSEFLEIRRWRSIGFRIPLLTNDTYFHFDCRVLKALIREKWDAVIAYGYGSLTTWLVAIVAKFRKIPFVLWSDARLEYELIRSPITKWLKSLLHRFADHFVASGTSTRLYFRYMGIQNADITLSPYAIDNERFHDAYLRCKSISADMRRNFNISEESIVILYVGRLVKEKGIRELIKSISNIHRTFKITLVLVGDGKDRVDFEKLAAKLKLDDVIFIGHVPHNKVVQFYAIGDIFVLPSYKDVWGLVVNEAMVCGLPIVTTREVGAWRDLVAHQKNGFVIESHDVEALTRALLKLCLNKNIRRSMGLQSRDIIYQWDIHHAMEVIESVLKRVGNKPCGIY